MLNYFPFPTADLLTLNTNQNVTVVYSMFGGLSNTARIGQTQNFE